LPFHFQPCVEGAEVHQSLLKDAAALASTKGSQWKSEVLKLKMSNGSTIEEMVVMEFAPVAPGDQPNPPHAKVKLSLATSPDGPLKANSSIGDASFRDVRLQETNGRRTITFTRALDTISNPTKKTQQRLDRVWSVSFGYELKNDHLILKGFPKDAVTWGVTSFVAPENEITFKAAK
jgi:hypothetical protein